MLSLHSLNRGVEQLVARWAHNPKVTGSSPVSATNRKSSQFWLLFFYFNFSGFANCKADCFVCSVFDVGFRG